MGTFELTPDPVVFLKLCELVETLRGPEGCPWDRQQTSQSIIGYLVDEVYELTDAVIEAGPDEVCEELGDVLFLLLFLVQIYCEKEQFDLNSVLRNINAKMVRRHPHVFSDQTVAGSADVKRNWAAIKRSEKPTGAKNSIMNSIPHATPSLLRASRITKALADAGLDPRTNGDLWSGIEAALAQINPSQPKVSAGSRQSAYGELLWALVSLGRSFGVEPDAALSEALDKFEGRFRKLETELSADQSKSGADNVELRERIAHIFNSAR